MKALRILLSGAVLFMFSSSLCLKAQSRSEVSPFGNGARGIGIIGGFSSSNTSGSFAHIDKKAVSLYHAGIVWKVPFLRDFAIQSGVTYQMKGATLDSYLDDTNTIKLSSLDTEVGYVEIPLQLQWGPDLALFRPYIFAEPFIGYGVYSSNDYNAFVETFGAERRNEWAANAVNRLEYGLGFGAGIEFWQVQLSFQYFMNMGGLADGEGKASTDIANMKIRELITSHYAKDNFNGIKFSAVIFF